MPEDPHGREITLEQMLALRTATEAVSAWLRSELEERLEGLRPLLHPKRFLGDHVKSSSREEAKDADRVFESLQAAYKDAAGSPLKLPGRIDTPLEGIQTRFDLHPWEYAHETAGGAGARRIAVKSPVSWVLTHSSGTALAQIRQAVTGATARNDAEIRQFAINAILMKIIFERTQGLAKIFEAMRYHVEIATSPETGRLPMVRLTSCVPAFRPADGVMLSAVRLSGVPIFEELVDVDALQSMPDPIRDKALALAGA